MNLTLYRKELKGSWKLLIIFAAILTMYISMIISMYDPEMADALKQFEELMPELMAAVGMVGGQDTLMGFMTSYLYGMILLVFPMVYIIIRANGLIAKYVDNGSMTTLLSAPVKRTKIAATQYAAALPVAVQGVAGYVIGGLFSEEDTPHERYVFVIVVVQGQMFRHLAVQ